MEYFNYMQFIQAITTCLLSFQVHLVISSSKPDIMGINATIVIVFLGYI